MVVDVAAMRNATGDETQAHDAESSVLRSLRLRESSGRVCRVPARVFSETELKAVEAWRLHELGRNDMNWKARDTALTWKMLQEATGLPM